MKKKLFLFAAMVTAFLATSVDVDASDLTSKINPTDSLGGVTKFSKSYDSENDVNEVVAIVTLNDTLIENVLKQSPGNANSAASLGTFYFTLNPGLDASGYTFKKHNNLFEDTLKNTISIVDEKVAGESAVSYSSVWPTNLKIQYYNGSEWVDVTDKSNGGITIKSNLLSLLKVNEDELVYGKNYRFYIDPALSKLFGWDVLKDGNSVGKEYILVSYEEEFPVTVLDGTKHVYYPSMESVMNTTSSNVLLDEDVENALKDKNIFSSLTSGQTISLTKLDANNNFVYAWEFKGENITDATIPLNTSVTFTDDAPSAIKSDVSKLVTTFNNVTYLNFAHDGALPGKASVTYYVGDKYDAGTKLYIAHYNESTKKLENIGVAIVDEDGNVTFDITECSSYVLYTGTEVDNSDANTEVDNIDKNTAVENANTGDINLVIMISIIAMAAVGLTIACKKLVTR